ncbi:TraB/GumN family protein [Primorskyibacter aestuariivivens]|uniref:TraB/GumN family protein n=1 Tax=Primorskyibacter aestuariivivens TaxID=1888912 RepID=UPI002300FB0A|nr:TraB/GumN family protein [Primorskyibacter aestuariivivens]MDA7429660.1 TraB/GumN family protein [Primorskyibacter aestuariivivens]
MDAVRVLVAIALMLVGLPAFAQGWATRDVCDVPEVAVFESAFAPATEDDIKTAADHMPNGVGRLWRIEAPNGAVSHLWGTMHVTDPRILDLPDRVLDLIDNARVVALEIDPIMPSRRAYERDLRRADWFRNGRSDVDLSDSALPADVLEWIRQRSHGLGWGRNAPDRLTLGAVAELLLSDPCDDFAAGILPVQDGRIQMLGMIAGAEILALEEAMRIKHQLDGGEGDFAIDFLLVYGSYLNPETKWQDRATSFALYLEGRIAEMMAWDRAYVSDVLGDGGRAIDRVNAYLLDARNHAFVDAAESALQQGGVFIAVGCFHLPGAQGMVALLRERGFTVTRVPVPGEV